MSDSDGDENASDSIRIEGKKADLPTSVGNDLQAPGGDDLQAEELPNLVRASENRANEGGPQAAFDFARERISKFRRHKTVTPIAAFEKL